MVGIHLTCVVIGRFPITVCVNIISRFLLISRDFTRFPLISGDFCDFYWFLRFRMISQDSYDFSGFQWFLRISMIPCDFARFPLISGDSPWFLVISVIFHDSFWFLWFCVISRDFSWFLRKVYEISGGDLPLGYGMGKILTFSAIGVVLKDLWRIWSHLRRWFVLLFLFPAV